jgi:hypothetical protein
VVDDSSKARFRLVKLAPYDAETFEALSGVEAGERIIESLSEQINDGASVEIRP